MRKKYKNPLVFPRLPLSFSLPAYLFSFFRQTKPLELDNFNGKLHNITITLFPFTRPCEMLNLLLGCYFSVSNLCMYFKKQIIVIMKRNKKCLI